MPTATLKVDRAQRPGANELAHSAEGLLALMQLPRVGPKTALRAALVETEFDELIERHAAVWPAALAGARRVLERCAEQDIAVLGLFDTRYPQRLRAIHEPPPVLFVRGSSDALHNPRVAAVVGTREPTQLGERAAVRLASALASEGWGIVSGLARGVDTLAHEVALRHGVPTVAALAGGLDRIYPQENSKLAAEIVKSGGALIAEVPPGTPPRRSQFIARDRLQAALAVGVVVAQTSIEGGTMHTVRYAAQQGRPVFCAPPGSDHAQDAGLTVLLQVSACELADRLPAWADAQRLSRRLGSAPLAHVVGPEQVEDMLDALEYALSAQQAPPAGDDWSPSLQDARDRHAHAAEDYDESAAIFAFPD